jgi:hypothetical protein
MANALSNWHSIVQQVASRFFTPGSGIWNRFFPDLGSQIPNPYFSELSDNFLGKNFNNSLKIGPIFFSSAFQNKIILNFVKFVATKKYNDLFFFTPLVCCCFWIGDPRSGIRDPRSGIPDKGWVKIRIRDKHPGSATLVMAEHHERV